ncbi:MAG: hypothetical protein GF418_13615 [Chitinivibrionales bacterium]|nr:hypothetical protein [Chitinivibrionales bacterium]MBD3396658.1 hypothetical protein [Chitinivibrionales bacterium]
MKNPSSRNILPHIFALAAAACPHAETGMGLIVSAYRDQYGPVYRIDMKDGMVIHTEKDLGISEGICPRFSPDGTRFAYAPKAYEIRICKLDGQLEKTIPVSDFSRSMSALSWTQDNFIWATAPRHTKVVKYNIETGEKAGQANINPDVGNGAYVSRNEETVAWNSYSQSYNPDYQRFVMDMAAGTVTRLGAGCAVSVSPDGQYILCNNASYNGHSAHTSMSIFLKDGTRYKDYYRETMLDWPEFKDPSNHGTWNRMVWSGNSNDIFCLTAGLDVKRYNALPWIYNIADDKSYCLYEGDKSDEVKWWWCFDFYEGKLPGPLPPAIGLGADSLGFGAAEGKANPAEQTVTVTNKGGGTLSGVSVSDDAAWLNVELGSAGSQAWSIANAVDITGLAGGVYTGTVIVSAAGAADALYAVTLTVYSDAALTSLRIMPSVAYVAPEGTRQFAARGLDQFGEPFDIGTVTWAIDAGGNIDATGLFTASSAAGGPFTVTAAYEDLTAEATVLVTSTEPVYMRINCGRNAWFVNGWGIDDPYARDGTDQDMDDAVVVDGIEHAADPDIYRSARSGDGHSYTMDASVVPNGTYTVRLHLVDNEPVERGISYRIGGETVLDGINIADEAGGVNRALVKDFVVTVADNDGLQIACAGSNGDEPRECGIEVFTEGAQPAMLVIDKPAGGDTYANGGALNIKWHWTGGTVFDGAVVVEFSPDAGLSWYQINAGHSIGSSHNEWGDFTWRIGAVGETSISPVSNEALVRLKEYEKFDLPGYTALSQQFAVDASGAAKDARKAGDMRGIRVSQTGRDVIVEVGGSRAYAARMVDMQGRIVWKADGRTSRRLAAPRSSLGAGVYILSVVNGMYRWKGRMIAKW